MVRAKNDTVDAIPQSVRPGGAVRLHAALSSLNNILLIPMFTLMALEASSGEMRDLLDAELGHLLFSTFFMAEWALGLYVAPDRRAYLRNPHMILDFVSSVPLAQVFQSARLARLLRLVRLLRVMFRARRLRGRGAQLIRAAGLLGSTALAGALALRAIEPTGTKSLTEALWWAIVTISTVGYGDVVPESTGGRVLGVALIICGIGVFGYVTGVMAALLQDPDEDETIRRLARIEAKLEQLGASAIPAPLQDAAGTPARQ